MRMRTIWSHLRWFLLYTGLVAIGLLYLASYRLEPEACEMLRAQELSLAYLVLGLYAAHWGLWHFVRIEVLDREGVRLRGQEAVLRDHLDFREIREEGSR